MARFVKQFLMHPTQTGAIAPSSDDLSEFITDIANLKDAGFVVELGTGTGAFTQKIMSKIPDGCTFFGLEINPYFVKETLQQCPSATIYNDTVVNIDKYVRRYPIKKCEVIISGLPWTSFKKDYQNECLLAISNALSKNGRFLTFAYVHAAFSPAGLRFSKLLKQYFPTVKRTRIIWKNLPPAFVYSCKKC